MLLAIDTSGPFCSAALLDGDTLIERSENIGRGHAERLMGMLEELLGEAKADWKHIARVACSTGPGSFTGLRVGLATARGLALALDCPCTGVTVFEAFAEEFGQGEPLCVAMDAKRDQIWMQNFARDGVAISEPMAVVADEGLENVPQNTMRFAGSAAGMLADRVDEANMLSEAPSPPIAAIARIAVARPANQSRPKPLYMRAPDAKPQTSLA